MTAPTSVIWLPDISWRQAQQKSYLYLDLHTMRQFRARQKDQGFFLEEIVPLGIRYRDEDLWLVRPDLQVLALPPNQSVSHLTQLGAQIARNYIDWTQMQIVYAGTGFLPNAPLFSTLKQCSEQVARVLQANIRYLPTDTNPVSLVYQSTLVWVNAVLRLQSQIQQLKKQLEAVDAFNEYQLYWKVLDYLEQPSPARWKQIASLPISNDIPTTFLQAWRLADSSAPAQKPWWRKWRRIPSAFLLRRGIEYARRRQYQALITQLQQESDRQCNICNLYSIKLTSLVDHQFCRPAAQKLAMGVATLLPTNRKDPRARW